MQVGNSFRIKRVKAQEPKNHLLLTQVNLTAITANSAWNQISLYIAKLRIPAHFSYYVLKKITPLFTVSKHHIHVFKCLHAVRHIANLPLLDRFIYTSWYLNLAKGSFGKKSVVLLEKEPLVCAGTTIMWVHVTLCTTDLKIILVNISSYYQTLQYQFKACQLMRWTCGESQCYSVSRPVAWKQGHGADRRVPQLHWVFFFFWS